MAEDLFSFFSQPGIRRDGTELDSPFYNDGQWVRWQRHLPRKMGGYAAMSQLIAGPVRSVLVDSRNNVNSAHYFSPWGVQRQEFADNGSGNSVEDRTPAGFAYNSELTWSRAVMTSSSGGSYAALLAAATPDVSDLASDAAGRVYSGNINDNSLLVPVEDSVGPIEVSGGVCVLQPFAVVYGSNGLIRNSNANDFSASTGWTTGGSNLSVAANVAGTKMLFGAPVRGGANAPAGLFWAVDALVRMSFVGGTKIWSYDTLTQPTSVLSKRGIVEHDGKFFWPGTDRFMFYNGVVQELPNEMNLNWFFDNLNMAQRNKVWGTKVPRWGEIWWFFPWRDSLECDRAIIYNYRENTWYDAEKSRSAGDCVQVFPHPVWAGEEDSEETVLLRIGYVRSNAAVASVGDTTLSVDDTSGLVAGMWVVAVPGVPPGTTVLTVSAGTVEISAPLTSAVAQDAPLTFTTMGAILPVGAEVEGASSGATGELRRVTYTYLNLVNVTGDFVNTELVEDANGNYATTVEDPAVQVLVTSYQHERGTDKVVGQEVSAIPSFFTSRNFGFAVGSPFEEMPKTLDAMTAIDRMEPDLGQVGNMTVEVLGRSFAQDANEVLNTKVFSPTDSFVDLRAQQRILSLRLTSNARGGHYQQGNILLSLMMGDERSSKQTR